MNSILKKYWLKNVKFETKYGFAMVPSICCKDGFTMSVQASKFHYCKPKETLKSGDYTHWEIGFPSAPQEELMPYCGDHSKPMDTVYAYVPTQVILDLIAAHGGIEE